VALGRTAVGIDGLHVAVTGAAGGIGAATVAALVAAGARVSAGDLAADAAGAVATSAAADGPGAAAGLPLDVTDTASYRAFLSAAHDRFGPLDVAPDPEQGLGQPAQHGGPPCCCCCCCC